jgi:LPXTG-motif cell wall-anchored protein
MIKVEDVVNKIAEKESEKYRNAGDVIPGTVKEVNKGKWWPIIIALIVAAVGGYFLFRKKESGNEGVSG